MKMADHEALMVQEVHTRASAHVSDIVPMNADICTLVQPVVFAGGAGTRLWPLSRERYPKQLLDLFGTGTLLQTTVSRLDGLAGFVSGSQALRMADHTLVVCGESHRSMMQEQLREARYRARFIVEPVGRNTAPAMTVAALAARTSGPGEDDPILVAMPADHVIGDSAAFHASIACAIDHARRGAIATLGIVPARAETAFGYMAMGEREPCEGGRRATRLRSTDSSKNPIGNEHISTLRRADTCGTAASLLCVLPCGSPPFRPMPRIFIAQRWRRLVLAVL